MTKAAVAAVLFEVRGLDVAAEIAAIDFRNLAFAADHAVLELARHRLAELVQEHEGALVGQAQIAGDRQRGLALDLVAEDRDGREIHAQRQLVRGEQRARGQREVLGASPAAEAERSRSAGGTRRRQRRRSEGIPERRSCQPSAPAGRSLPPCYRTCGRPEPSSASLLPSIVRSAVPLVLSSLPLGVEYDTYEGDCQHRKCQYMLLLFQERHQWA